VVVLRYLNKAAHVGYSAGKSEEQDSAHLATKEPKLICPVKDRPGITYQQRKKPIHRLSGGSLTPHSTEWAGGGGTLLRGGWCRSMEDSTLSVWSECQADE
jgi:hypothetical protein